MTNHSKRLFVGVALILILLMACDGTALAGKGKNRKGGRGGSNGNSSAQRAALQSALNGLKSQVSAASRALVDAQQRGAAAAAKASAVAMRQQAAGAAIDGANSYAQEASAALEEIQNRILESQDSESAYVRLRDDLKQAKADYDQARRDVQRSPPYQSAYREAVASANKAELITKVRQEFIDNNTQIRRAHRRMETLRRSLATERHRLLSTDPDWQAASEQAHKARLVQARAQRQLEASLLHRAAARTAHSQAARQASAAQATIQQGGSAIKSLEQKSKGRKNSSKSGNYKRRKR